MKLSNQIAMIDRKLLSKLTTKKSEDIEVLDLSIRASHSGKINNNLVFYTPKAIRSGATTLTVPYNKNLQDEHFSYNLGPITDAEYISYSESLPKEILELESKIESAETPEQLVNSVKQLVNSKFYDSRNYKGLGCLQVGALLYNKDAIDRMIKGSIKGEVSIGGKGNLFCSICCEQLDPEHEEKVHSRGLIYNGEMCFGICDALDLDHIGFVPDPADPNTQTIILTDSNNRGSATVVVENIRIQDNNQGNKMKLEQLKALASNLDSFVNVEGTTAEQQEKLKELFRTSTKHARGSSFLMTEDKLLPINTKEMTALSYLAIQGMEDSQDKEDLLSMIKQSLDKHFKEEEDIKAFVTDLFKETEQPVTVSTAEGDLTVNEGEAKVITQSLSDADIESIAKAVYSHFQEQDANKEVPLQDSASKTLALNRIKQLESDIELVDATNKELREAYKQSLISNILALKGLTKDSDYAKLLQDRSLDVLKANLEDIEFEKGLVQTKTQDTSKNVEDIPQVTTAVQDNVTVNEQPDLSKVSITDSLQNVQQKEPEVQKQTSVHNDFQAMKQMGVAEFIKQQQRMKKGI